MPRILLKQPYRDPVYGAINYAGEIISVSVDVAEHLIHEKAAQYVKRPQSAAVETRSTKPADAGELKGLAKLHWLKREIKAKGGEPKGRTIADLSAELKGME